MTDTIVTSQNENIGKSEAVSYLKSKGININLAELGQVLSKLGQPLTRQTLAILEQQLAGNSQVKSLPTQSIKQVEEERPAPTSHEERVNPRDVINSNNQVLKGIYESVLAEEKAKGEALGQLAAVMFQQGFSNAHTQTLLAIYQGNVNLDVERLSEMVTIDQDNHLNKAREIEQKKIQEAQKVKAFLEGMNPSSWN